MTAYNGRSILIYEDGAVECWSDRTGEDPILYKAHLNEIVLMSMEAQEDLSGRLRTLFVLEDAAKLARKMVRREVEQE